MLNALNYLYRLISGLQAVLRSPSGARSAATACVAALRLSCLQTCSRTVYTMEPLVGAGPLAWASAAGTLGNAVQEAHAAAAAAAAAAWGRAGVVAASRCVAAAGAP